MTREATPLAGRIQSILDELTRLEGKRVTQRELARRAGLSSESHVGLLMKSHVKHPRHDILEAIAKAGDVELQWLSSGEGPRRRAEPVVERDERYVQMKAVREMGLSQGFDPVFVDKWEALLDADDQPDADYLWTLMKADWAKHQRKSIAQGNPLDGIDDVPGLRSARKKR